MNHLFTSESVSGGHPDKLCDRISDGLLDEFIRQDPESKVAIETLATTGLVVVAGEVKSDGYVNIDETIRKIVKDVGYTGDYGFNYNSCGIVTAIHEQSPDINQGVVKLKPEEQGAGDQGIMFGYATNETEDYMPMTITLAHQILMGLEYIRKYEFSMLYLRPDAKSQVTIRYENNKPVKLDTVLVSTQHEDFEDYEYTIRNDIKNILLPMVFDTHNYSKKIDISNFKLLVNPTGRFVIGGPQGDTGLTGRKIIVDTYGGWGAHGGGAFSGKDPSKVDRSGAYMARYIAKNLVAAGIAERILVQLSYSIGIAEPISVYVDTYGTGRLPDDIIASMIPEIFNLKPYYIIDRLKLKNPIYSPTAAYGHFGRKNEVIDGFEYFTWEKLDKVDTLRTIKHI